jgi:hypothetical protein
MSKKYNLNKDTEFFEGLLSDKIFGLNKSGINVFPTSEIHTAAILSATEYKGTATYSDVMFIPTIYKNLIFGSTHRHTIKL